MTSTGKEKRSIVEENVEVYKKDTFDRCMFTNLELTQRFNLHFANRVVILGKDINFSKLGYFRFDNLFSRMR